MSEKTLEQRTDEAITKLEFGLIDQTERIEISAILREWKLREAMLREQPAPAIKE